MRSFPCVETIIKTHRIRPRREKGQNFLKDERIMEKILEHTNIKKDEIVLEIGAAPGIFTRKISEKAAKVFAVEVDKRLAAILRENVKDCENVEVIEADILNVHLESFAKERRLRIVANIPYNITKPILQYLIKWRNFIEDAYLLLQKEVAERICMDKGRKSGPLSIFLNLYMNAQILFHVERGHFFPQPSVDSSLVHIWQRENIPCIDDEVLFSKIVKVCFLQRRKMLKNALSSLPLSKEEIEEVLKKAEISPFCRAEELGVEGFLRLFNQISSLRR